MIVIYLSADSSSSLIKSVRKSVQDAFPSHSVRIVKSNEKALSVSHKNAYVCAEAMHAVYSALDDAK